MATELWIARLSKAAELWIVILYMAAKLQFVRLLKVKHKRKLRLFLITTLRNNKHVEYEHMCTKTFSKGIVP